MQSDEHGRRLTQEETDCLVAHLKRTEITDVAVANALKKLPDLDDGSGKWPDDWRPHCQKCDEEINDGEMMGTAFGCFYHGGCVPSVDNGPMPVGQYLAGVENAR